mgnify:CR=1 FL=1
MSALYFKYQAFDTEGKVQNGQLNAQSEREAIRILQGKNLTPVKLQETRRTFERGLNKKIRHTDICLLYTSPSPRDATLSRMPSSA